MENTDLKKRVEELTAEIKASNEKYQKLLQNTTMQSMAKMNQEVSVAPRVAGAGGARSVLFGPDLSTHDLNLIDLIVKTKGNSQSKR